MLECARCGVIFAKLVTRPAAEAQAPPRLEVGPPKSAGSSPFTPYVAPFDSSELSEGGRSLPSWPSTLPAGPSATPVEGLEPELKPRAWMLELIFPRREAPRVAVAARAVLLAGLGVWGGMFLAHPIDPDFLMGSFMHLINLPFHEAGHVFFMPLGRFMAILGGSLGQLIMPSVCLSALLFKTRDAFGASVCLWWLGQSLLDLAPYIDDARALELVLLGGYTGKETGTHDWNNLLGMLGWLEHDHLLARLTFMAGAGCIVLAVAWGAELLCRQWRPRRGTLCNRNFR